MAAARAALKLGGCIPAGMMTAILWAALVLGDVPPPEQLGLSACGSDDECVITTQLACCEGCCPARPQAVSKKALGERDCSKKCAAPMCKQPLCRPVPDASSLKAVCRAGTCRAEPAVKQDAARCQRDADCISASASCCDGCCPPAPEAMTVSRQQKIRSDCAQTMCAMVRCAPENCPPVPVHGPVVCRAGQCEFSSGPTAPGADQCQRNDDCEVSYPSPAPTAACHQNPCGCCPGTKPVPVSKSRRLTLDGPAPKNSGEPAKPKFGLSTPQCSPCPSPEPATAVCNMGRCALK